jgi:phage terminase small subunit
MGRRPKPTALHKLHGTYNATNHGRDRKGEPVPLGDLEEPPPDLTESQEAGWRYAVTHMPKGVVKLIDRTMLRVWVEAEDRHNTARMMQAMLDQDTKLKLLVKGPNGLEPSPYNTILDKTAQTLFRAAQELGFSPAARPRLRVASAPDDRIDGTDPIRDPWSMLQVIPGGKKA